MDVGLFLHLYKSRGRWIITDLLQCLWWLACTVVCAIIYYKDHLSANAEIQQELDEPLKTPATFLVWATVVCGVLALWYLCRTVISALKRDTKCHVQ